MGCNVNLENLPIVPPTAPTVPLGFLNAGDLDYTIDDSGFGDMVGTDLGDMGTPADGFDAAFSDLAAVGDSLLDDLDNIGSLLENLLGDATAADALDTAPMVTAASAQAQVVSDAADGVSSVIAGAGIGALPIGSYGGGQNNVQTQTIQWAPTSGGLTVQLMEVVVEFYSGDNTLLSVQSYEPAPNIPGVANVWNIVVQAYRPTNQNEWAVLRVYTSQPDQNAAYVLLSTTNGQDQLNMPADLAALNAPLYAFIFTS